MSLSTEGARGARAFVWGTVTLICDNDEGAYNALTAAAGGALTGLRGMTLEEYRRLYGVGSNEEGWWAVARAAGDAVTEEIGEWIEGVSGVAGMLLTDLLDLGDAQLWAEIGWHYLPEPDDLSAEDFDGYEEEEA